MMSSFKIKNFILYSNELFFISSYCIFLAALSYEQSHKPIIVGFLLEKGPGYFSCSGPHFC